MSINCSNACIIVLAQASVATHIVKSRLALQTDLACYGERYYLKVDIMSHVFKVHPDNLPLANDY